jgi:hypothetical protein
MAGVVETLSGLGLRWMMANRWRPMGDVAQALQAELLPPDGELEAGRGVATIRYLDWGLRRVFWLGADRYDRERVVWEVFVEDATYGNGSPLGPCAVWVRPPEKPVEAKAREAVSGERGEDWENGYRRPTPGQGLSARLVFDLARWARPALAFVADRRDLGYLLLNESDVRRGEVSALLGSGLHASRLVNSVMLARDLGDDELERAALDKLARNRDRPTQGWSETFGAEVAYWAGQYAATAGVDLADLVSGR